MKTGKYRVVQLCDLPIYRVEVEHFRFWWHLTLTTWKPFQSRDIYGDEFLQEYKTAKEAKAVIVALEHADYESALRRLRAWEPR